MTFRFTRERILALPATTNPAPFTAEQMAVAGSLTTELAGSEPDNGDVIISMPQSSGIPVARGFLPAGQK